MEESSLRDFLAPTDILPPAHERSAFFRLLAETTPPTNEKEEVNEQL